MFRACLAMEKNKDEALLPSKRPYLSLSFANLGMVYRRLKRFADAKQILQQSIGNLSRLSAQVDSRIMANIHRELGSCFSDAEEYRDAVEQFNIALSNYELPSIVAELAAEEQKRVEQDIAECRYSLASSMHRWALQKPTTEETPSWNTVVDSYMAALESGAKAFGEQLIN